MAVISLAQLRIASPCTASWDDMAGDDRSRYCKQCHLHVYNFAAMSQGEIESLILQKEGRVCARLFQRTDGTVLVRDCPVGFAALRRRAKWVVGRIAAGIALAISGSAWAIGYANPFRDRAALNAGQPFATLTRWMREPEQQGQILLGAICPLPMPPGPPPPPPDATIPE